MCVAGQAPLLKGEAGKWMKQIQVIMAWDPGETPDLLGDGGLMLENLLLQTSLMFQNSFFAPFSTRLMINPSQTDTALCIIEFDHLKTNFLDLAHQDFWFSDVKYPIFFCVCVCVILKS